MANRTKEIENPLLNAVSGNDIEEEYDARMWSSSERKQWLVTLLLGTSALYASRTSVPLVMPEVTEERGWTKTDSGTVLSSFFWGYTLTQVVGGYLSDRYGGEKILLTAAVGWGLVTFWMPQIMRAFSSRETLMKFIVLTRVLHGAFQGVHFPSMSSISSQRLVERDRASFFSAVASGAALGTLITGTLGSYILEVWGWQAVFHTIGFLSLLWAVVLKYYSMSRHRRKPVIVSIPHRIRTASYSRDSSYVPWLKFFKRPAFWSCVIGHACQTNCFFILLSWLPTYFHDTFPGAKGWVFNVVPWVLSIPSTFFGSWLTEHLLSKGYSVTSTRKIIEALCLGIQSTGLVLISHVTSFHGALLCMTLAIGASGFHNNAIVVNPSDLAPKHSGSVFGLMNTVGAIPGFVGVYLAGYILEVTKSWAAVFQVTALINVVGGSIFLIFGSALPIV